MAALRSLLASGILTPGEASKLAGRLSFSVPVSGNRVGRTFFKSFYAQAHSPLPGFAVSPLLRSSVAWFLRYLSCWPQRTVPRSLPGQMPPVRAAGWPLLFFTVVSFGGLECARLTKCGVLFCQGTMPRFSFKNCWVFYSHGELFPHFYMVPSGLLL